MNVEHFLMNQESFLKDLLERTQKKQREYARNSDAFHNFKQAAGISICQSPVKLAWEFNVKHLQSLRDLIEDHSKGQVLKPEQIDEKIGDVIVYMTLIREMLLTNTN
jgi:hypothetical protein